MRCAENKRLGKGALVFHANAQWCPAPGSCGAGPLNHLWLNAAFAWATFSFCKRTLSLAMVFIRSNWGPA